MSMIRRYNLISFFLIIIFFQYELAKNYEMVKNYEMGYYKQRGVVSKVIEGYVGHIYRVLTTMQTSFLNMVSQ